MTSPWDGRRFAPIRTAVQETTDEADAVADDATDDSTAADDATPEEADEQDTADEADAQAAEEGDNGAHNFYAVTPVIQIQEDQTFLFACLGEFTALVDHGEQTSFLALISEVNSHFVAFTETVFITVYLCFGIEIFQDKTVNLFQFDFFCDVTMCLCCHGNATLSFRCLSKICLYTKYFLSLALYITPSPLTIGIHPEIT